MKEISSKHNITLVFGIGYPGHLTHDARTKGPDSEVVTRIESITNVHRMCDKNQHVCNKQQFTATPLHVRYRVLY